MQTLRTEAPRRKRTVVTRTELMTEALAELAARLPGVVASLRRLCGDDYRAAGDDHQLDAVLCEETDELAQLAQIAVSAVDAAAPYAPEEWTRDAVSEKYRREIPGRLLEGLNRYALRGERPGKFLTAVLDNDLLWAIGHADPESREALPVIVEYAYNRLPASCWGSPKRVREWEGVDGSMLGDALVWPEGSR